MRPGDVAFSAGPHLAGIAIRVWDHSRYNHTRLVVSEDGDVMESVGNGFRPGKVQAGDVIASPPLTDAQRAAIPDIAQSLHGTPYGYVDVFALGLAQLGIFLPTFKDRFERRPVGGVTPQTRIARPDRLFCSQSLDLAWNYAGFRAFRDGRKPGNVTPGDIADLAFRENWPTHVI